MRLPLLLLASLCQRSGQMTNVVSESPARHERMNYYLNHRAKQDVRLVAIAHPMHRVQQDDDARQLDRCR